MTQENKIPETPIVEKKPRLSKLAAKHELWRKGNLTWKLDKNQKELYDMFNNSSHRVQTWLLARRSGKSYALCVLAAEQCIKHPNSIVKFLAPTKLQINTILRGLMREILIDCPEEIKPEFSARDYVYYFKNGSEMQLAGSESGHAEKLRGGSSHIAIVDEAGDVTDLDNVIKSILLPTTLTTRGKVLLAGTPPKNPDHDFVKFIEEAELRGSLVKKIVDDNPRLSKELIKEIEDELGGRDSEAFRREMLCELIKDTSTAVIPEFNEKIKKEIVKDWPRPPYFDAYVAMDLGTIDLTFLVFGYYDFRAAKVIIEDELCLDFTKPDMNLKRLSEMIKDKENNLYFNAITNEVKAPYMRVSDIDYMAVKEISLASNKQINFTFTQKDNKDAQINALRTLIGSKNIIINPRCVNLIRHLDNVKWASSKNKTAFGRSPDNGHYDGVDALIYFVRSIVYSKNPYPATYNLQMENTYFRDQKKITSNNLEEVYYRIFNVKKR